MRIQRRTAVFAAVCLALTASAGALEYITVGDPGNAGELSGQPGGSQGLVGAVAYDYQIGKYEVTAGQYTEFLNAAAAIDPFGLYNPLMATDAKGCGIVKTGPPSDFTYSTATPDLPVNFVNWGDAARYANWIENGRGNGSTEMGAYPLYGAMLDTALKAVVRSPGATSYIASEDEWYKAAYYNPATASYFDYATSTDTQPVNEAPPGGTNSVSYMSAVGNLVDVGAYTASVSPYGTYGQSGNVSEWTDSMFLVQGTLDVYVIRGGTFADSVFGIRADTRTGAIMTRLDEKNTLGFRMVSLGTPGDFDGDWDVDADDIDILCDNMGGDPATYDLDGDLDVDEDDLTYLVETLVEWDNGVDTGVGSKRGDFNLDGLVNATDLAIMKATFGTGGVGYAGGNANCDDIVNATDLAILKSNFGFTAPTGGSTWLATGGGVPEPATLAVLAMGGLALLRRKQK